MSRVLPSVFISKQIPARDYTVADQASQPRPAQLASSPFDAGMHLQGFCFGTANQFAHISSSENALQSKPPNNAFPFYNDAMTIPTGERFEIIMAPGQSLWTYATVASETQQVWLSYTAVFLEPEVLIEVVPGQGGGPSGGPGGGVGTFRGPRATFIKVA